MWVVVMGGDVMVMVTKYSSLLLRRLFTLVVVLMLVVRMGGKNSFVYEEHAAPRTNRPAGQIGHHEQALRIQKCFGRGQKWIDVVNRAACSRRDGRNRLRVGRDRCV